ncbi:hypothetical protein SETIT_3G152500v2 [Setaria italica]|uniref:Peroxidase n=1 Tax=Setaria italica TaxID=4555 RepID=A0A368QF94_SETIT|nr:hypothetical protein SETIT_3G152500v2 [Setaria italica]
MAYSTTTVALQVVALLLTLTIAASTATTGSAAPVNTSCVTGSAGATVSIGYSGARASAGAGVSLGAGVYRATCPRAEEIVRAAVERAVAADPRMAASIIRLHLHDCFVNVRSLTRSTCLDATMVCVSCKLQCEDANSLRDFEVIDAIKAELERECPETVSCADLLAIAARDSVVVSGGPSWEVEAGRKDGRTASLQGANVNLPAPTSGVATLRAEPSDQAPSGAAVPGAEDDDGVAGLVAAYAFDASVFFQDFAESMLRMGRRAPGGGGGEVRTNCRVVNSSS